jgi:aspartyl-tRNA(Asn)/glutamyl-tRNA(Gln) amidotransferase subunit B
MFARIKLLRITCLKMDYTTQGEPSKLPTKIGLEIHVQLRTKSKLFCSCSASYRAAQPNRNVCPVCTGQPGSKPWAINSQAIGHAVKLCLAVGAKLKLDSPILVLRKHYFYPDLPSGYQRTSKPLAVGGKLCGVNLTEVHFEEDPGQFELRDGTVDYNRSGVPLIEIVTEPEFKDPQHARDFLEELSAILEYLGTASAEPGSMRVDANLSVAGHNRVEVKNINSFHGVLTALQFEAARQRNLIKNNLSVSQETRHFDEGRGTTVSLRKKETADDYRYFPDPDILPLIVDSAQSAQLEKTLPELPTAKRQRFQKQYGIMEEEAFAITLEQETADAYELVAKAADPKIVARFFRGVLRKQLNYRSLTYAQAKLSTKHVATLLQMLLDKNITEKVAETALIAMIEGNVDPREFLHKEDLIGVEGEEKLKALVAKIAQENPSAKLDYRAGKPEAINFLAGKVIADTRGRADPQVVQKLLQKLMTELKEA